MSELVIGVSNIISPLCYSLLRLEPYDQCLHGCTYCYARWYRPSAQSIKPLARNLRIFRKFARYVRRKGLRAIPARLSTLVDPFQPVEEVFKVSLRFLEIAQRFEYPIIVCCKGTLLRRDPWKSIVEKLVDRKLLVLQVSISTLDEDLSKVLEPNAPSPRERLALLKEFGERGCPAILRLSPFLGTRSLYPNLETFADILKEYRVSQVIVEALRIERERVDEFSKLLGFEPSDFEGYSLRTIDGLKPVVRISLSKRFALYRALREALSSRGIAFATCKEGLFNLHTAPNCCGMHYLDEDLVGYRPTLYEIYRYVSERGALKLDEVPKLFESLGDEYLWGSKLRSYPRRVSKPLRGHEKRLLRVLKNRELLSFVSPCLGLEDSIIVLRMLNDPAKMSSYRARTEGSVLRGS